MEKVDTVTIKELLDKTIEYAETNVNLAKMKLINKGSSITSSFLAFLIIAVFVVLLIVLLSIGLSLWIGKAMGETYYGFFITAGIFLVLIFILYKIRGRWLKMPIANSLLQSLYK